MPVRWAVASGNFSNLAIWNDSASLGFPTASDDIWANNNNINIDQSFSAISLNSTARARDIATPAMTSNTTPSPYVAAASGQTVGTEAYRAFDRTYTVTTGWAVVATTGWLSMDFGSGSSIVIDGYTIYSTSTQAQNPRNWSLQGSNDSTLWTDLHIVSGAAAIPASSTYSVSSISNTQGYRYYRINVTLNGGSAQLAITELELYQRFTAALAAGGSFIFNSGSISGSATSTTTALSAGATNLIQVTAATGSVTLNLGSTVNAPTIAGSNLIVHSGNCNLNLNGLNFTMTNDVISNRFCINKTSTGTITIVGNLIAPTGGSGNSTPLTSNNGNTILFGNAIGGGGNPNFAIDQSAGNVTVTGNVAGGSPGGSNIGIRLTGANSILTVTGNVTGGTVTNGTAISLTGAASQFTIIGNVTGGTATNAFGINHSGTSGSVIGNVTAGSGTSAHGISTVGAVTVTGTVTAAAGAGAYGINNTAGITTITGNVLGNTAAGLAINNNTIVIGNITGGSGAAIGALGATANFTVTVTGTVAASSTAAGIFIGGGTGNQIVNLTGNMLNASGRQAIVSNNLFISDTATTQWRLFTAGGQDKTLYSADTFPNQPSSANVRNGSLFGPSNVLSGSMVVPIPSNVRVGVLTDNTVGTGQSLTAADFLAAISASADPYAQRLRNVATVDTVGSLLTGFNNGGF